MDRRHKYVFTTTDDCRTFKKKAVTFTPDDITFHDTNADVVLAYDKTSYIKRVKVIQSFYCMFIEQEMCNLLIVDIIFDVALCLTRLWFNVVIKG